MKLTRKNEKKLSEDYISALTNIFFGKSKETLEFHECSIASKGVTVVDDEIRALMICTNICDFVRSVANDKLGKPNFIEEFWNRISKDEKMFKIFSILAEKGTIMNAKEISIIISDSAWNRKLVNDNIMNLLRDNLFIHKLIMRVERGKYKISDIGQYLWKEFGPKKQTEGDEISEQPLKLSRLNKWTT